MDNLPTTKKNIALVYPYFNKFGGVERIVYELAQHLYNDFNITVVTGHSEMNLQNKFNIRLLSFLRKPTFLANFSFAIISTFFLKNKFDLIHSFGASCLKPNLVSAQSCHKYWFKFSLANTPTFSKPWWLKILNPLHYLTILIEHIQYQSSSLKKILAVSELTKQEILQNFHVAPHSIEIIPNGVNYEEFRRENNIKEAKQIKKLFNISDNQLVIIFVANEFKRKGLEYLIKAVHLLQNSEIKLLVCGKDQPYEYMRLAQNLNIPKQIIFAGKINHIAPYFSAADIFAFPTTYEAFGLVILEAMAAGLAVITSKTAGAASLIQHRQSGLLLDDPRNPIELAKHLKTLLDKSFRAKLGREAEKIAQQHSWRKIAESIKMIYRTV